MALAIERRLERLWYGKSNLVLILQPFAFLFRCLVTVRRWAFRAGLLAQHKMPVPVIVVGNITSGGTGKTPLVAWLVRYLEDAGLRPGIVSRGYGGQGGSATLMVTPDSPAHIVGDEALLLAKRTGVPVCVCTDRVSAARKLAELGVDIIIADDGMQHYRLARDLEIAVLDGERGIGNGRLLPAGPLREAPERLNEVDLVLVNGDARGVDGLEFRLVPTGAIRLDAGESLNLDHFAGRQVLALAGIGNPNRFYRLLESARIEVLTFDVPDHGVVSLKDLRHAHILPILMTEKDAVKYPDSTDDNVWYVPVDVRMPERTEAAVVDQLRKFIPTRKTGS